MVTTSGLHWPWLLAVAALLAAAVTALAVLRWRRRRRSVGSTRWVAATGDLDELPQVRALLRRYRVLRSVGAGALVLALAASAVLVARPVARETVSDRLGTRDIVICLDISGSMVPFDAAVLRSFTDLVESFQGERIALSVWNSTSRTVFPLTDDYPVVLDELEQSAQALDGVASGYAYTQQALDDYMELATGTMGLGEDQSSLIGDGLASCGLLFDESDDERSRSIVLVTDNQLLGDPIYTLQQAVDMAAERDITLFGLYSGEPELYSSSLRTQFDQAIQSSGGHTWFADDPDAINGIVDAVMAEQATDVDADPEVRTTDTPRTWFVVLTLALAAFWVVQKQVRA